MKFKEYLMRLDKEKFDKIILFWGCWFEDGKFTKTYYINSIMNLLIGKKKFINVFNSKEDKNKFSDEERTFIFNNILGIKEGNKYIMNELTIKGILCDGEIIEEFEHEIILLLRNSVKNYEEEIVTVCHTSFMKLNLIINYLVNSDKTKVEDIFKIVNFEPNSKIKLVIKRYLEENSFYEARNDKITAINYQKIRKSYSDRHLFINKFYKYVVQSLYGGLDVAKFLKHLKKIIYKDDEGVLINEFEKFIRAYRKEIECLKELGLLKIENNVLRFSSEGWYLTTGQEAIEWTEKRFIVTSDFEVFMTFSANPFDIGIINYFSEISKGREGRKNNVIPYDDDYYIISNISKALNVHEKIFDYKQFKNTIVKNTKIIPDIVKENLIL